MKLWFIIIILCFTQSQYSRSYSFNNVTIENRLIYLTNCLVNATKQFSPKSRTSVLLPLTKNIALRRPIVYVLKRLVIEGNLPISVENFAKLSRTYRFLDEKVQNYLIYLNNEDRLEQILRKLSEQPLWNPHAKFLAFTDTQKNITDILKTFLDKNIQRAVLLHPDVENHLNFKASTLFPYKFGHCGNYLEIFEIDSCISGKILRNFDWFPDKLPDIFNKCEVRVNAIFRPPFVSNLDGRKEGLDVLLLNTIAHKFNLKMRYLTLTETYGVVCLNGSATGAVALLKNGVVDIGIGGFVKSLQREIYLDSGSVTLHEDLIICAPLRYKNRWANIFSWFDGLEWTLVIICGLLTGLFLWLLEKKTKRSLAKTFFAILGMLSGQSIHKPPTKSNLRYFFGLSLFLSFVILCAFQTVMISTFTANNAELEYKTIEDIYKKKLKICFSNYCFKRFFEYHKISDNPMDLYYKKLNERSCQLNRTLECFDRVSTKGDLSSCAPRYYQIYYRNRKIKELRNVYCFEKQMLTLHTNILMKKGFFLAERMNTITRTLFETGFIKKWLHDILGANKEDERLNEMVTLRNLKPVFVWIFGVGNLLAFCVFVVEILVGKRD